MPTVLIACHCTWVGGKGYFGWKCENERVSSFVGSTGLSRRRFHRILVRVVAGLAVGARLSCGQFPGLGKTTARPNVGAVDHDRMVRLGDAALGVVVGPVTSMAGAGSPGGLHDYFSTEGFREHRDGLRAVCVQVGALAGAYGVTREDKYAAAAAGALRRWFVAEKTRMTPHLRFARVVKDAKEKGSEKTGTAEGVIEGVWLAEMAMGVPFLAASAAMTDADLSGVKGWLGEYLKWLTVEEDSGPRIAALARDLKNHHGSSWLLQATALAKVVGDDQTLAACRHRFERVTLRAQVVAVGSFPAELVTKNPYRDSLLNLDMLAGSCEVLSTGFESVWDYELQDGPGMRAALAYHFPFIEKRAAWPYPADASHFGELPLRRPALVFAAKAYTRPEYADVWKSLPSDPVSEEVAEAFPIRQPYLWVTRPPRRVME